MNSETRSIEIINETYSPWPITSQICSFYQNYFPTNRFTDVSKGFRAIGNPVVLLPILGFKVKSPFPYFVTLYDYY